MANFKRKKAKQWPFYSCGVKCKEEENKTTGNHANRLPRRDLKKLQVNWRKPWRYRSVIGYDQD